DLDPVAPPAGEDNQVPGKRIQIQILPRQRMQSVKALAHVAGGQTQIDPHAGWQVDHARSASSTFRNAAGSAPAPIRSRSPVFRINPRTGSIARCPAGPVS